MGSGGDLRGSQRDKLLLELLEVGLEGLLGLLSKGVGLDGLGVLLRHLKMLKECL